MPTSTSSPLSLSLLSFQHMQSIGNFIPGVFVISTGRVFGTFTPMRGYRGKRHQATALHHTSAVAFACCITDKIER